MNILQIANKALGSGLDALNEVEIQQLVQYPRIAEDLLAAQAAQLVEVERERVHYQAELAKLQGIRASANRRKARRFFVQSLRDFAESNQHHTDDDLARTCRAWLNLKAGA